MEIENISVENLIPYAKNAKKHPQEQVEQIKQSISEFGFNDPLAVDENNVLIEGHAILIGQVQKALKGSIASAEFIRDTVGQRPEDIINLNTEGEDMTLNINVSYCDEIPSDNSEAGDKADDEH